MSFLKQEGRHVRVLESGGHQLYRPSRLALCSQATNAPISCSSGHTSRRCRLGERPPGLGAKRRFAPPGKCGIMKQRSVARDRAGGGEAGSRRTPFARTTRVTPANVRTTGEVTLIPATARHPAGALQAGGYDPTTNTLHLGSGAKDHPRGVAATGGDSTKPEGSGITDFQRADGTVFGANDSFSLPRQLTPAEAQAVQEGLQHAFPSQTVQQLDRIGDVPP